jgi:hypothetical protein
MRRPVAQALSNEGDLERQRVFELEIEQFDYHLRAAYAALRDLEGQAGTVVTSAMWTGLDPNTTSVRVIQVGGDAALSASWAVDRFLDALRRAQNALVPYLIRTFRTSLPQSMSRLATMFAEEHRRVPSAVRDLITDYWRRSGSRVKDYRDFAQHHAVVASDMRVAILPSGERALYLVMASNPERKSLKHLVFNSPYIPALPYCRHAFIDFFFFSYLLFYLLTRHLGYPATGTIVFNFKEPLRSGVLLGYVTIPTEEDLDRVLWSCRKEGKARAIQLFGDQEDATFYRPPANDRCS